MKSFRSILKTDPMTSTSPLTVPRLSLSELDEEFSDVVPLPQDDGPELVCKIDYPPNFTKVFDLFRAILQSKEISVRVLGLTGLCLAQNPANYTVWHVRRQCLFYWSQQLKQQQPDDPERRNNADADTDTDDALATQSTASPLPPIMRWLPAELEFTASLAGANPKNYQVWYHRRSLLQALVPLIDQNTAASSLLWQYHAPEIAYIDSVLQQDGKNYHAWSHRQWMVLTLSTTNEASSSNNNNNNATHPSDEQLERVQQMWNEELQATNRLIIQDLRNNSAWNHRWFVLHRGQQPQNNATKSNTQTTTIAQLIPPPNWETEVAYCLEQVHRDVYNESSCRYLAALAKFLWKYESDATNAQDNSKDGPALVENWILPTVIQETDETNDAPPIWSTRADLHELVMNDDITISIAIRDGDKDARNTIILECLAHLEKIDPIRRKYWQWRMSAIRSTMASTSTPDNNGNAME